MPWTLMCSPGCRIDTHIPLRAAGSVYRYAVVQSLFWADLLAFPTGTASRARSPDGIRPRRFGHQENRAWLALLFARTKVRAFARPHGQAALPWTPQTTSSWGPPVVGRVDGRHAGRRRSDESQCRCGRNPHPRRVDAGGRGSCRQDRANHQRWLHLERHGTARKRARRQRWWRPTDLQIGSPATISRRIPSSSARRNSGLIRMR